MSSADAAMPPLGPLRRVALTMAGGALGAVFRWGIAELTGVGIGTVVVNSVGALILGWLAGRGLSAGTAGFWMTGVMGSFTTFSTLIAISDPAVILGLFGADLVSGAIAAVLLIAQVLLGVALAAVGVWWGRRSTLRVR